MATVAEHVKDDKLTTAVEHVKDDKLTTVAEYVKDDKLTTVVEDVKDDKLTTAAEGVKDDKLITAAEGVKDDKLTTAAEQVENERLATVDDHKEILRRINREHATAVTELQMLETYTDDLVRRASNSRQMGHIGQTISTLLRHSVAESVKDVYIKYVFCKMFQAVWMVNKTAHDMNSDSAFRRGISAINTRLVRNIHSVLNENHEDDNSDRNAATLSAIFSYHSRSC